MSRFIYTGSALSQISFPLGGIGTGSLGLSGTGRLVDWEIFNRPNKGSLNGFSHFAVKVEENGRVIDARVLNSDLQPPYMGDNNQAMFNAFGFGPPRHTLAGVPHFRDAEFDGHYPRATIRFSDETFPGQVALSAWNPFIPLNDKDSSLPLAIFEITVTNTASLQRDFVLAFSVNNPLKKGVRYNEYARVDNLHLIRLLSTHNDRTDPDFGDLTLSVEAAQASCQQNWFRGGWFDNLGIFWQDFTRPGDLVNRVYWPEDLPAGENYEAVATLAARVGVTPGQTRTVRFALAWHFPNVWNYWNPVEGDGACCSGEPGCCSQPGDATGKGREKHTTWQNYYATIFRDSTDTTRYLYANLDRLERDTARFMAVLYRSSLPEAALEAVSANLSLLRTPTCLRLTDGSFYGFEGCHGQEGCCEGSCTHVWNYAYVLPYLFPRLERSVRDLDYRFNSGEDGSMSFRLQLPVGRRRWQFRPCADGQMGGLIKVFREWQICGDTEWLRSIWPEVKKSLEYAWSPTNLDRWDPDRQGYLSGRQHHTLDMELFGPNPWLTGFYLAALAAGVRMAEALGDQAGARQYMEILERGKAWVDQNLFNGEYFYQKIDLKDASLLDAFKDSSPNPSDVRATYWNEEAREIKYQIGEGSSIDQVLAQWHCDLVGLGDIFDRAKVRSALAAVYRYNYHDSFRNFFNPCRIFCLNDEAGTTICAWPAGTAKPVVPAPYSEETMHGFEYQVGIHMIMNGLEKEGLDVVKAVRDRYDGVRRNPWNEFECGSNYARSMASYALLLAYSGFACDMTRGYLAFRPIHAGDASRFLWSVDQGWGEAVLDSGESRLDMYGGQLQLRSLGLPEPETVLSAAKNGQPVQFSLQAGELVFAATVELKDGDSLVFGRCPAAAAH